MKSRKKTNVLRAILCCHLSQVERRKMGREDGLMVHKMHIPKITDKFTYFLRHVSA